jgi:hypothetical protein
MRRHITHFGGARYRLQEQTDAPLVIGGRASIAEQLVVL